MDIKEIDDLYWLLAKLDNDVSFSEYLEREHPEFDRTCIDELKELVNDFEREQQEER